MAGVNFLRIQKRKAYALQVPYLAQWLY